MKNALSDLLKSNQQAKSYFDSLPPYIQETLHQTSIRLETEEDLKNCVKNITG